MQYPGLGMQYPGLGTRRAARLPQKDPARSSAPSSSVTLLARTASIRS
jgi:hypothetical protein